MASLSSLNIKVLLDGKQFSSQIKNMERSLTKFGKKMSRTGKNLSMYMTAPIAALGVASVKAFDQQQKAIAQVEAGLKSTGATVGFTSKELQKMASDLQKTTLFGDEEILKGATAQLLTFTNITGQEFAKAQESALDLATRLDGDLKSASIMLGKALNDPVANLSAMSRAGIQFSEDQKSVIKSLWETGNQAEAQSMILAELEKQYGGSAEAAAKAGMGPLKQLQNSIGDLSEAFGKIIAEYLMPFIQKLTGLANKFMDMDESTQKLILTFAGIAAAIGPVIFLVGKLSLAFKALMTTNPILLALTAVVAVVIVLINKMGGLSAAWKKVSSFAVASAKTIVERFKNVGSVIAKIFQNLTKTIMAPLKAASLAAKGDFEGAKKALEQNIISPFSGINKIWDDGTKKINGYWTELDKLKDKQEKVADSTKQITNATKELNQTIASGGSGGSGRISSLSTATTRGVGGDLATSQQGVKKLELQRADNGDMEWAYTIDNSKIVDMQGGLTQVADMTSDWTKKMQETAQEFNDTVPYLIKDGLYDLTTGLGEAVGNLMSGQGSMQDVFNTILMSLADFGKQFGEMLIGIGIAQISLETALSSMNPVVAIAAGTALVALASAAKNFISQGIPGMATGGIAAGGLTLVGERGPELVNMPRGATVRNATATANMMGGSGELTTKISGRDLEIILNRTKAQSLRR
jgi:hypothetical protein